MRPRRIANEVQAEFWVRNEKEGVYIFVTILRGELLQLKIRTMYPVLFTIHLPLYLHFPPRMKLVSTPAYPNTMPLQGLTSSLNVLIQSTSDHQMAQFSHQPKPRNSNANTAIHYHLKPFKPMSHQRSKNHSFPWANLPTMLCCHP